jgi:hypothetical protein
VAKRRNAPWPSFAQPFFFVTQVTGIHVRRDRLRVHVHDLPKFRIDGRTTRRGGYAISQCIRKRIEEAFGWIKTVAGQCH